MDEAPDEAEEEGGHSQGPAQPVTPHGEMLQPVSVGLQERDQVVDQQTLKHTHKIGLHWSVHGSWDARACHGMGLLAVCEGSQLVISRKLASWSNFTM